MSVLVLVSVFVVPVRRKMVVLRVAVMSIVMIDTGLMRMIVSVVPIVVIGVGDTVSVSVRMTNVILIVTSVVFVLFCHRSPTPAPRFVVLC